MHRGKLVGKDLVIAVGGDGTVLNSASFLNDKIPLLGDINRFAHVYVCSLYRFQG